jgi:chorismate synthase
VLSINAVKAVSIGDGLEVASLGGRVSHDPIAYDPASGGFTRASNRAGGLEGGMSNGEIVRVTGYLKPLATLLRPLPSVDLVTKESFLADVERTDTIPIVAAGVVAEAMVAFVLAGAMLEKFGGDAIADTRANIASYRERLRAY